MFCAFLLHESEKAIRPPTALKSLLLDGGEGCRLLPRRKSLPPSRARFSSSSFVHRIGEKAGDLGCRVSSCFSRLVSRGNFQDFRYLRQSRPGEGGKTQPLPLHLHRGQHRWASEIDPASERCENQCVQVPPQSSCDDKRPISVILLLLKTYRSVYVPL